MLACADKCADLERVEQQIATCRSYQDLNYINCGNDTSLCLLDSLNILAADDDLYRLFLQGNGIQSSAAFVLIGTRKRDSILCQDLLRQIISDTTRYVFHWSDDVISDMPVGGFCFSWARQQELVIDEQFGEQIKGFGNYDTWSFDWQELVTDDRGIFTRKWYGMFSHKPATFPGGQAAMMQFICDSMHFNEELAKGVQLRAICHFIVDIDGSITEVEVVRSSGNENFDREAVRLIQSMPQWSPATDCGKPVPESYHIPVKIIQGT